MKFKFLQNACYLLVLAIISTSCASVGNNAMLFMPVNAGAKMLVKDRYGKTLFQGPGPAKIRLSSVQTFFSRSDFQIELPEHQVSAKPFTVSYKLDGWYMSDVMLGEDIGVLVVDANTGFVYKPTLSAYNEMVKVGKRKTILSIYDVNQVPAHLLDNMQKLN